jgi:hypothetical protein
MQVLANNYGERVRIYRPYINREESAMNVSIFVPESSTNTNLYGVEPVDHLTGNAPAGTFSQEVASANYWWGMKPFDKVVPPKSYAAEQPGVYSNPQNMQRPNYIIPPYQNMGRIYGAKPVTGHRKKIGASYGGI